VEGQVHAQIMEAISKENLSQMYVGWASWLWSSAKVESVYNVKLPHELALDIKGMLRLLWEA